MAKTIKELREDVAAEFPNLKGDRRDDMVDARRHRELTADRVIAVESFDADRIAAIDNELAHIKTRADARNPKNKR